jgi:uncharacterized ferritin-like protein (DUF455 family)
MEITEWATRILSADTLEEKLFRPPRLTDNQPGPAIFWHTPTRPVGMEFKRHTKEERLPSLHEHGSKDKRAICLHRFAGHELLAVEIMAYALLAFPDAPNYFRKGLTNTLQEEQEHVRLYIKRLAELGVQFGDLPLYKHFWSHTPYLQTPIKYISVMSLTFEMANLDFAPMYRNSFAKYGDTESACLMQKILEDEISHVSFGYQWLKKFKALEESEWQAWRSNVPELLPLKRARGFVLQEEPRRKALIPDTWIESLHQTAER